MWHGALLGQLQQLQFIIPEAFNQQLLVLLGFWATKCHKTVSQHLQTSQHLSTIGSDGFTEGRTDREWRRVTESGDVSSQAQESPWCCKISLFGKKNWMPLDRRINWCHLLKHGSLWLVIVVLGSHWKSLCNWCAMHLWSVQFLSNQLLKLLRTRTKCAERRLDFVLCGSHVHQFASHKQHTEANHTFCCGDFALDAELFQQLPSLLFTPQDSMAWRFPQNHA